MSLEIQNVSYIYHKGLPHEKNALTNVSLTIPEQAFIAVIGHTGSGKSTLMQIMNGLLKPEQGKVLYNGEDIHKDSQKLKILRQKVGLVFQYPEQQLFEETVSKEIAYGPSNMELKSEEIQKRIIYALKLVGLDSEEYLSLSPFNLSGGEKRRVALAGVLAMQPEILILDEPTAGLDPSGREEIMGAIAKLQQKAKIAVVLVTHSMEEVSRYAHEVHVLNQGSKVFSGTPREVFAQPEILAAAGLRLPGAAKIIADLKTKGFPLTSVLNTKEAATEIAKMWRN